MAKYEHVKRWRKKTKLRLIDAFGGKCGICGYNKSRMSLEFHHLDPTQKDFSISSSSRTPNNWYKIVEEARKCVMLCRNCHTEVHDEECETEVPDNIQRFNESYAEYKEIKEEHYDECPECGGLKPCTNVTCSIECARKRMGRRNSKVDWDNVDVIALLNEHKTYTAVGKMLGITPNSVKKRYMKVLNNSGVA